MTDEHPPTPLSDAYRQWLEEVTPVASLWVENYMRASDELDKAIADAAASGLLRGGVQYRPHMDTTKPPAPTLPERERDTFEPAATHVDRLIPVSTNVDPDGTAHFLIITDDHDNTCGGCGQPWPCPAYTDMLDTPPDPESARR